MKCILRRKVKSSFTVLPNDILQDARLSWSALGILCHLLHLPEDYSLNYNHLSKRGKSAQGGRSGRAATRTAVAELRALGYINIAIERGPRGRYSKTVWTVTDDPFKSPKFDFPISVNPTAANPNAGNPISENRPLQRTNKNKELITQRTTTAAKNSAELVVVGIHELEDLRVPDLLSAHRRASALSALATCPAELRQSVLDEIEARSRLGTAIRSPIDYLKTLIGKALDGSFVPTASIEYAEKKRRSDEEQRIALKQHALQQTRPPPTAECRQAIETANSILGIRPKRVDQQGVRYE